MLVTFRGRVQNRKPSQPVMLPCPNLLSFQPPNPKGSREILAGDVLLCFGKALTLKGLAPPKKPRRTKRRARPPVESTTTDDA